MSISQRLAVTLVALEVEEVAVVDVERQDHDTELTLIRYCCCYC